MSDTDKPLKTTPPAEVSRVDRDVSDNSRTQMEGTAYTMEERRAMLRSEWQQEVLPTPPKLPGWHTCWLSTTNSSDPIYKRVQKGYEPVKISEVPGFSQYTATQGEFEGCVACNEMVLFKVPEELYQDLMSYFHYELPMEEEEMLRANAEVDGQDSNGKSLGQVEGDGFNHLVRRIRKPTYQ